MNSTLYLIITQASSIFTQAETGKRMGIVSPFKQQKKPRLGGIESRETARESLIDIKHAVESYSVRITVCRSKSVISYISGFGRIRSSDILDHPCVHSALKTVVDMASSIAAWSLAGIVGRCKLLLHGLIHGGQEYDFAVCCLGHRLHRLEVPDLHSRSRGKNISRLEVKVSSYSPIYNIQRRHT